MKYWEGGNITCIVLTKMLTQIWSEGNNQKIIYKNIMQNNFHMLKMPILGKIVGEKNLKKWSRL